MIHFKNKQVAPHMQWRYSNSFRRIGGQAVLDDPHMDAPMTAARSKVLNSIPPLNFKIKKEKEKEIVD